MNLSDEQIKVLNKYNIDYKKCEDISDLLDILNDEMISYVDDNDEPTEEFLELQKVYDSIYENNKSAE